MSAQQSTLRIFMTETPNSVTEKMLEVLHARIPASQFEIETNMTKISTCDLVIGDRHGIPFKTLRATVKRAAGHSPPLVNFFEGAHNLTLKVSMAKLLKEFPSAQIFCPRSFVIIPKSLNVNNNQQSDEMSSASPSSVGTPLQERQQQQEAPAAAPAKKPARRSALPSRAERMALAAALTGVAADADDRDALAQAIAESPDEVWIAKPTAGAKGLGIILSRSLDEILQHAETFDPSMVQPHSVTFGAASTAAGGGAAAAVNDEEQQQQQAQQQQQEGTPTSATAVVNPLKASRSKFLVQRYIANPLLVRGRRKFDIRVWCALASPPFDIFVFSQGSCRTASQPYTGVANLANVFEHVTNHDLQQFAGSGYGQFEAGNEMWYSQLAEFLEETYNGGGGDGGGGGGGASRVDELRQRHGALLNQIQSQLLPTEASTCGGGAAAAAAAVKNIFEEFIRPQLHNVVVQSFLAAKPLLQLSGSTFGAAQIFGLDVMLDDELNVHLLEINGAPGFAQALLEQAVTGAIDTIMAPRLPELAVLLAGGQSSGGAAAAGSRENHPVGVWEKVYSCE